MTLAFPNPTRSFDATRNAVRFLGHDGMVEVRFFIEASALGGAGPRGGADLTEDECLSAFDRLRSTIQAVALKAYAGRRLESYTLTTTQMR
ncbi:DUF1488 domain-containing protein [Prosthecomicrobium hirschii]|uniref:DUF1488 domain-containing protein n=1 Tax=Prosthecodimorpha hirschii TaxID=665126 RepID=A0A0P6VLH0_9HYPH|nr:DUF1488 domain-containing protein [Prosthecomicrobium hirschii]KPL52835.1 hypothetical protein ABB55_11940 [Prosthecomicrobium hirschii]MCW1841784.1 DUF1488 domain-containing protein [Prosthecomicrobium hirschii]TPQ50932.1 DUF1488 domain-containing protein [Prosthecomicrobium hirschii]